MGGLFPPEEKAAKGAGEDGAGGLPVGGLPCPGFEGFEKRLEVEFWEVEVGGAVEVGEAEEGLGLRRMKREALDEMLTAAACTIVSHLPNEYFDSYVLSESSLFVYPKRVVIKTCGTTKLLNAIPNLLKAAEAVGYLPRRCKYTRGTFMFPAAQPSPHNSFEEEAKILEKHFGNLGAGGKAFVLGDALKFPNWHVYVADMQAASKKCQEKEKPLFTLEMCMTELDRKVAGQFYQEAGFQSSADCTKVSGIGELLPKSHIDDFLFEPCGYSMNGIEENAHSTIHITPEDGFSYASFETMGYGNGGTDLGKLVKDVATTFKPGKFSIALHTNGEVGPEGPGSWGGKLPVLENYICEGTSRQELPLGAAVVFHTFKEVHGASDVEQAVAPLPLYQDVGLLQKFGKSEVNLKECVPQFDVHSPVHDSYKKFGAAAANAIASIEPVLVGAGATDIDNYISAVIAGTKAEEAFYVMDLGVVMQLWKLWTESMPRVKPFYAVKCNPDPALLSVLASLGTGFDVASKAELDAVLQAGVSSDRMIYANPCKLPSHIRAAAEKQVTLTTFDSESELFKLKKYHPGAEAVLRIRADDREARCPLGVKYGAEMEDCEDLLKLAKKLGVKVVGVAFHVGSGASNGAAFADGIEAAREIFNMGVKLGMEKMSLLDIGGGFTSKGGHGVGFNAAASAINAALDLHFPEKMGVKVIAEPGRFFAEAPVTLATHVFGSRFRGKGMDRTYEYWINDGIYGSMNCLLYDHAQLSTRPLASPGKLRESNGKPWVGEKLYQSTIFGPTCDGLDTVLRDAWLPQLDCGDVLVFPRMGAYTQAAGSSFNGFSTADIGTFYVYSTEPSESSELLLEGLQGENDNDSSSGGDESLVELSGAFGREGEGSGDSSSDFGDAPMDQGFSSGSDDDSF